MSEKCVLYFSGGVNAGVFGAGVGGGLLKANFYNRVGAIYGASAGAFNGAYFLTGQFPVGPSIYYDDLVKNFILAKNIPFGTFQRFCKRYFGCYPGKLRQAVDLDYVMGIVSGYKALVLIELKKSKIPLFSKLWDIRNGEWKFVDAKTYKDPLRLFKAATSLVPYYYSSENINGSERIDLSLADPLCLDIMRARHPTQKIIFIYNHKQKINNTLIPVRLVEGVVANFCYKEIKRTCFVKGLTTLKRHLKEINLDPRMLIVSPPDNIRAFSHDTNRDRLIALYEAGVKEAEKIVNFVSA